MIRISALLLLLSSSAFAGSIYASKSETFNQDKAGEVLVYKNIVANASNLTEVVSDVWLEDGAIMYAPNLEKAGSLHLGKDAKLVAPKLRLLLECPEEPYPCNVSSEDMEDVETDSDQIYWEISNCLDDNTASECLEQYPQWANDPQMLEALREEVPGCYTDSECENQ